VGNQQSTGERELPVCKWRETICGRWYIKIAGSFWEVARVARMGPTRRAQIIPPQVLSKGHVTPLAHGLRAVILGRL